MHTFEEVNLKRHFARQLIVKCQQVVDETYEFFVLRFPEFSFEGQKKRIQEETFYPPVHAVVPDPQIGRLGKLVIQNNDGVEKPVKLSVVKGTYVGIDDTDIVGFNGLGYPEGHEHVPAFSGLPEGDA